MSDCSHFQLISISFKAPISCNMKHILISFGLSVLFSLASIAQQNVQFFDHGSHTPPSTLCLSPEERANIEADLSSSRTELIKQGKLQTEAKGGSVLMNFPLAMAPGSDWNAAYGISGYVDQDPSGGIQSHFCDSRTYNGHMGTDYYSWPFGGYLMETEMLHIVAAAPGTIIYKNDGQYDQQCDFNSTLIWNAVYVEHSDGTIAWYGHMKEGSLTSKAVGQTVELGEYLGVVGSSGFSSGPHLHFELHNSDGSLIDPYFGDCNSTDFSSTWVNQPPYWEMELNTLLTHSAVPEFGCPAANEEPNIEEYFNSFETVFLAAYFKEQIIGAQVDYRVRTPDGTIYSNWTQNMDANYESSYWYWTFQVPIGAPSGAWTFEADYDGNTFIREFFVNQNPSGLYDFGFESLDIYPNPVSDILNISRPIITSGWDKARVQITDAQGRIIKSAILTVAEEGTSLSLDLSALSEGVYLLIIEVNEQLFSSRFVKQ
jgi:hypothetical protein